MGHNQVLSCLCAFIPIQFIDRARCSRLLQSVGDCVESVAGVFQLFLQWFMFTVMYVVSFVALCLFLMTL